MKNLSERYEKYSDGCYKITCRKFEELFELLNINYDIRYKNFFRGHSKSEEFKLISSIDREYLKHAIELAKSDYSISRDGFIAQHLNNFRKKIRGKVDSEDYFKDEIKAWSLGQHYGLYTPYLDWTESPYIAAFFATIEYPESDGCIYILNFKYINEMNQKADTNKKLIDFIDNPECKNYKLQIIEPMTNFITRLNAQNGSFTKTPDGIPIDDWINCFPEYKNEMILIKVIIPKKLKPVIMYFLNQANINYSTIYPDLTGICKFCNLNLQHTEQLNEAEVKFYTKMHKIAKNFLNEIGEYNKNDIKKDGAKK